jgi:hypothetical protein
MKRSRTQILCEEILHLYFQPSSHLISLQCCTVTELEESMGPDSSRARSGQVPVGAGKIVAMNLARIEVRTHGTCMPSSLRLFLPSFIPPSHLSSFLPPYLPSFLPSLLPSLLPSFSPLSHLISLPTIPSRHVQIEEERGSGWRKGPGSGFHIVPQPGCSALSHQPKRL